MPLVDIDGLVSFAANVGVLVKEKALSLRPEELAAVIRTAFSHLDDPPLVEACCGGSGPLASYTFLTYNEYLAKLREIEIAEAGVKAKQTHSAIRRAKFNQSRSHLVLAMLAKGVPYVCAVPDCGVTESLSVDHIVPLSRGGIDALENLQFMCVPHNSAKGDRNGA